MTRNFVISASCAVLLLAAGCAGDGAGPASGPEEAFAAAQAAADVAVDDGDRVRQWEGFLSVHPDNEYTMRAARKYLESDGDLDPVATTEFFLGLGDMVEDAERGFSLAMLTAPIAREAGIDFDLVPAIEKLEAQRPLTYWEHWEAGDAAIGQEHWTLAEEQLTGALALASPEAYRAENPDREITDEKAERRGKRRKVWALPLRGWALANQGLAERAEADFAEADSLAERNFIGLTDAGLDSLRGRAALMAGDADRAVELLGLPAVMGGDEEALASLAEALEVTEGTAPDMAAWVTSARPKLARDGENFTLANYDQDQVDFSRLKKGKVTLLAFWFPT